MHYKNTFIEFESARDLLKTKTMSERHKSHFAESHLPELKMAAVCSPSLSEIEISFLTFTRLQEQKPKRLTGLR
jgi:hypothetical protein